MRMRSMRLRSGGDGARARRAAGLALVLLAAGPGCDLVPPSGNGSPSGLAAPVDLVCRAKQGKVDVAWGAVPGAYAYRVERSAGGATATLAEGPPVVFADFAPPVGTPVSYTVVAVGPDGESPASAPCTVTVSSIGGPDAPAGPACAAGDGSVRVWWPPRAGIASWRLLRRIDGGAPAEIADTRGSVVDDVALQNAVPHSYTLVAVDAQGRASRESAFCQATPSAGATQTGVAPEPVAAFACRGKESKADLSFTPDAAAAYHRVYRSADGGPEALVGQTAGRVYADFGLEPGRTYRWTIESVGSGGRPSSRSAVCVLKLTGRDGTTPVNRPPAFASQPLTTALEGHYYYYEVAASDPEGDAVVLSLQSGPPGMALDAATGLLSWTPATSQIGPSAVELRATDAKGAYASQAFVVSTADFNEPPRFTSVPTGRRLKVGQGFAYDAEAFDPEGQSITFGFASPAPAGVSIDPATGAVAWTPGLVDVGSAEIALRATDPAGAFATQRFSLDVTREPLDLVEPAGSFDLAPGQKLSLQLVANYASAGFRVKPDLPNAKLTGDRFEFTPDASQAGDFELGFEAVLGEERDVNPVTIRVRRTNRPPVLAPIAAQRVSEGVALEVPVSATDPDADDLRFSAPGLSLANAVFDEVQRRLLFTPGYDQAGSYGVTIAVTDGRDTVQQVVDVVVDDAPPPQTVTDLVVDPVPSPTFLDAETISGSTQGQAQPGATGAAPLLVGLAPTNLRQGRRTTVDVTGLRTAFDAGPVSVDFGAGVAVEKVEVISATQLKVTVAADLDAEVGVRAVRATQGGVEAPSVIAFVVEPGVADVSGTLLDSFTGAPLAAARVTVQGATGVSVVTDAQGRFQLTGVPPGEQALVVVASNYAVKRIPVSVTANSALDLAASVAVDALARPFNPGGTLPRAATVASVLDRGVAVKDGDIDFAQARAVVLDTMLAIGGNDVGVLDHAGNQLNPNLGSDGLLSITPAMVDYLAERMVRGETYTLGELAYILDGSLGWAFDGMSLEALREQLERAAGAAWRTPADPLACWAIVLLNEGRGLDSSPPAVTSETRFNAFQAFLFVSAQILVNLDVLNEKVDALLVKKGIDPNAVLQQQGFPASMTAFAPDEGGAWRMLAGLAGGAVQDLAARVLPRPAFAQTPPAKQPPNTVQESQRKQGGWAAVGRALGPAAVSSLLPALIAAAFVALLVLIAFVAGGPILGVAVAGAGWAIAGAFGVSFLSAFAAKLLVAGLADPNAAENFTPEPVSRTYVVPGIDPTTGQRKAKIVFRKSAAELERDRLTGLGGGYDGLYNTDLFDLTLTQMDPKYVDFRYHLFRFDDPNPPLQFKPGKAELLGLRPLPVPRQPDMQKFVVPASALQDGDNWLGVVTVQFYRQMWTQYNPDSPEAIRITYPDLGVPPTQPTPGQQVMGNVGNEGQEALVDFLFDFWHEPRLENDPIIDQYKVNAKLLAQQREAQMLLLQQQADAARSQLAISEALRAQGVNMAELRKAEEALALLREQMRNQLFPDKTVLAARQKVGREIAAWLEDKAIYRQDFAVVRAQLGDTATPVGRAIEDLVTITGQPIVRADAIALAEEAWAAKNLGSTVKAYDFAKQQIDLAQVQLAEAEKTVASGRIALVKSDPVKIPQLVPGTSVPPSPPRLSGAATEIAIPTSFAPADLADLQQLRAQLQFEKARLNVEARSYKSRLTPLRASIEAAANRLSEGAAPNPQEIQKLRQAIRDQQLEVVKHKEFVKTHQEMLDRSYRAQTIEQVILEDTKLKAAPPVLKELKDFQVPEKIPVSEGKILKAMNHPAAPGAGDAFGLLVDIGTEAYQARDQLAVLRSEPSNLFLVRKVDGEVEVPQQPIQAASIAPHRSRQLVRIVEPMNLGPAWPEPRLAPDARADVGALAAIDPFRAALRSHLALHDSGEPAGLGPRERRRSAQRSEALARHGIGAVLAQYAGGTGFAVQFETDPDTTNELAVLRPTPPTLPNPKAGYLVRDFPFTAPDPEVIGAGFPSDLIATDSKGRVYLQNLNSSAQFGGRIFRFAGDPVTREHVGSVTYFSMSLQYAKPTTAVAMEIGEHYDGAARVENLFVAELDSGIYFNQGIQPQNKILRLPIDQLETLSFYANGQNRERMVGQAWAVHPDFQMTGPSDMERDRIQRNPNPDVPALLFFSDEENVFAFSDADLDGQAEVRKLLSIPGRRWSGLAVDANGHLFVADWNSGEVFLLPTEEIDRILLLQSPISSDSDLDQRAFLIKVGLDAPGDVELDAYEQRYLVSTPDGFLAFDVPLVGRLVSDIAEIRVDVIGRDAPVTVRRDRGNIFFAGTASEGPYGEIARMRVRRVDPVSRQSTWSDATILTSPFGATVLRSGL